MSARRSTLIEHGDGEPVRICGPADDLAGEWDPKKWLGRFFLPGITPGRLYELRMIASPDEIATLGWERVDDPETLARFFL